MDSIIINNSNSSNESNKFNEKQNELKNETNNPKNSKSSNNIKFSDHHNDNLEISDHHNDDLFAHYSDPNSDLNDSMDQTRKLKKARCANCNRSMGIMKFKCRCDNNYCGKCRLPETHNCIFDYKEYHKKDLIKNNPIVIGEKIIKI